MDLLVTLCAQYHLNPSDHIIKLISTNQNQIKFKPNSLIGSLEAERVVLKPKGSDENNSRMSNMPVVSRDTSQITFRQKKLSSRPAWSLNSAALLYHGSSEVYVANILEVNSHPHCFH